MKSNARFLLYAILILPRLLLADPDSAINTPYCINHNLYYSGPLDALYLERLGRHADPSGINGFLPSIGDGNETQYLGGYDDQGNPQYYALPSLNAVELFITTPPPSLSPGEYYHRGNPAGYYWSNPPSPYVPNPWQADVAAQVNALYRLLLDREADNTGLYNYMAVLGYGWTIGQVAQDIMRQPEYQAKAANAPYLNAINEMYQRLLLRTPSRQEALGWANAIISGQYETLSWQGGEGSSRQIIYPLLGVALPTVQATIWYAQEEWDRIRGCGYSSTSLSYYMIDALNYISNAYQILLNRQPDFPGACAYIGVFIGPSGTERHHDRVASMIKNSTEYQNLRTHLCHY